MEEPEENVSGAGVLPLVLPRGPAAWLRVTGEDAASFLQGQFSQDVRPIGIGDSAYGLWLDHKGRVTGDGFVLRSRTRPGEFWVASLGTAAAMLRARLEGFIVADDVVLEDETAGWQCVVILDRGSAQPANPLVQLAAETNGYSFAGRPVSASAAPPASDPSAGRREWIWAGLASDDAGAGRVLALGTRTSPAEWERARILAGIPHVPADLGPRDLPQEAGLGDAAVSYAKGCYVGQEVMSRLHTRGRARRALRRVRWWGAAPAVPAPVFAAGRNVGELRSAAEGVEARPSVGLALLSSSLPDGHLAFGADGSTPVEVF